MSQRRRINRNLKIVSRKGDTADVYVEGEIGARAGTTAASFREQLARAKAQGCKNLLVHFNSPGGIVTEGMAMYNALRAWSGEVTGIVEGLAASIASVILMGCGTIKIAKGGFIMIHNPSGGVRGNAEDLRKGAEQMDLMRGEILDIYETRTGIERAKLEKLIDAETYFTAEEAVSVGVADSIESFDAKVSIEAVAKLDPSKVPAGLLASAKGKAKAMTKAQKKAKLEEEMKALQAKMAECEDSEEGEEEEDEEEDDKPKDGEDDDKPTDAEEEEEKKNLLTTIQEYTGAKTFTEASAKLAVMLSSAHSSAITSRATLVSAAIRSGKLEPRLKGMAMRATEKVFARMIEGMGGVGSLKLGKQHAQPLRETAETDLEGPPTAAELRSAKAMGITDPKLIIAARKQPMSYGKAAE